MSKRETEIATNIAAMLAQFATEAHELFSRLPGRLALTSPLHAVRTNQ
jgi:hypothetical protein